MVAQARDTGTALFPVLGKGGHAAQYGVGFDFASPPTIDVLREFVTTTVLVGPMLFAIAVAIVLVSLRQRPSRAATADRTFLLVLLPAVILADLTLSFGLGGQAIRRYAYAPLALLGVVALARMAVLVAAEEPHPARARLALATLCGAALVLVAQGYYIEKLAAIIVRNTAIALLGPELRPNMLYARMLAEPDGGAAGVRALQAVVPAGTPIFEHMDWPFLFDFRRNPISVVDWPGGASPPPGMPIDAGPERLAQYLIDQRIRYVAFSYGSDFLVPKSILPELAGWVLADTRATVDFEDNMLTLMRTRVLRFDDGARAVIDLAERRSPDRSQR
jgi:hypothetical protein